jgi:hypothetical protein
MKTTPKPPSPGERLCDKLRAEQNTCFATAKPCATAAS